MGVIWRLLISQQCIVFPVLPSRSTPPPLYPHTHTHNHNNNNNKNNNNINNDNNKNNKGYHSPYPLHSLQDYDDGPLVVVSDPQRASSGGLFLAISQSASSHGTNNE